MLVGSYTRNIDKDTKLYFVHVPKSGGTSVNSLFRNVFGAINCATHVESILVAPDTREQNSEWCRAHNFVSAHLPLDFYSVHFKPFGFRAIVTIRNPVEHFASQVAYLAGTNHDLGDPELEATRRQLQTDPNHFFEISTVERLDFFYNQQSRTIFGSDRVRLPKDALSRVSYLLERYDSIVLSEDIFRLRDYLKINGQKLSFAVPIENVRSNRDKFGINITDKIMDLLYEDTIIYDEIKKINQISDLYWEQLVR